MKPFQLPAIAGIAGLTIVSTSGAARALVVRECSNSDHLPPAAGATENIARI
jgi:hypothetical protein